MRKGKLSVMYYSWGPSQFRVFEHITQTVQSRLIGLEFSLKQLIVEIPKTSLMKKELQNLNIFFEILII